MLTSTTIPNHHKPNPHWHPTSNQTSCSRTITLTLCNSQCGGSLFHPNLQSLTSWFFLIHHRILDLQSSLQWFIFSHHTRMHQQKLHLKVICHFLKILDNRGYNQIYTLRARTMPETMARKAFTSSGYLRNHGMIDLFSPRIITYLSSSFSISFSREK